MLNFDCRPIFELHQLHEKATRETSINLGELAMPTHTKEIAKPATAGTSSLIAPHVSAADRLAAGGALRDKV